MKSRFYLLTSSIRIPLYPSSPFSRSKGHNQQTGEEIDIPETKAPAFKASKPLKELIK
ncbi:HU family DNA-binding protein [Brevibacillus daliensis]|uniref:HU family DNA-binding protein n=1 Tax=Brevibacillus daliensis TaxID=2892995 RepID=UPI0035A0FB72